MTDSLEEVVDEPQVAVVGTVIYDPAFCIVVVLVEITERGTAVFKMSDHSEGDGINENDD